MSTGLPVPFFLKLVTSGLKVPFAAPMVPPAAWWECAPPSKLYLPERFAQTGLDVVFSPKVEAVGARLGGYCDL